MLAAPPCISSCHLSVPLSHLVPTESPHDISHNTNPLNEGFKPSNSHIQPMEQRLQTIQLSCPTHGMKASNHLTPTTHGMKTSNQCLIVRACPRPGVYTMSRYLWSSNISTRGHSRGMGPC